MTKEGVASLRAARAARAEAISTVKTGGTVKESVLRGYGIQPLPLMYGDQPVSGYKYYDPATKQYVLTSPEVTLAAKAEAAKTAAELTALKATTSEKEKQVMALEYGLQQGMFSAKAAEKVRQQQQELMKDMPEKKPVETAFELGGKTFVGTYGLKKVYAKPAVEKAPAIYTGIPAAKTAAELKPTIPTREPSPKESSVPLAFPIQLDVGYRFDAGSIKSITSKDIESGMFLAPSKGPSLWESKEPSYSKSLILGKIDMGKAKDINLKDVDISKVAEYKGQKVTWENVGGMESALSKSNVLLQKSLLADQTISVKQASDIRIGEEVLGDVISFKSKEYAKVGAQFAATLLGVGAAGQVLGSLSKVAVAGKIIKVGSPLLKGIWGVSLVSRGSQFAEYVGEGQIERGLLGFAGLGAEVGGVYVAGKWLTATKGKPITDLYKKAKAPFFERSTAKWQKGLIDKNFIYSDKAIYETKQILTPEQYGNKLIREGKIKGISYHSDSGLYPTFKPEELGHIEYLKTDIKGVWSSIPTSSKGKVAIAYETFKVDKPQIMIHASDKLSNLGYTTSKVLQKQLGFLGFYDPTITTYSMGVSPQRTLFGEPISPTRIRTLRTGVHEGFYNIDIVGTRLVSTGFAKTKGFSNVDFLGTQHHITSDYNIKYKLEVFKSGKKIVVKKVPYVSSIIQKTDPTRGIDMKAIDWFQPDKIITITPSKMISYKGGPGYSQYLNTERRFSFIQDYKVTPTLGEKMAATQTLYWADTTTQPILKTKPVIDVLEKPYTYGGVYKTKVKTPQEQWKNIYLKKQAKDIKLQLKESRANEIISQGGKAGKALILSYKTDRTALDRAALTSQEMFVSYVPDTRTIYYQAPRMEGITQKIDYGPIATTTAGIKTFLDIKPMIDTRQIYDTRQIMDLKQIQDTKQIVKQQQILEPKTKLVLDVKQVLDIQPVTKLVTVTKTELRQKTGQKTDLALITDTVVVQETKITPELKIGIPIIDIIKEPEQKIIPFGFGFGIPSSPRKGVFDFSMPRARPRPRRREVTVEPFAGLYDVHVSEFMFGRATHPARTSKEKKKFKRRIMESAQLFPTVELEKAFGKRMKL